jgi:hypothetical protein
MPGASPTRRRRWLSMEGTSGAADLAALRGASGEAALGPDGRAAQAAKASNCAERCWPIRASGSFQRPVSVRRLVPSNPSKGGRVRARRRAACASGTYGGPRAGAFSRERRFVRRHREGGSRRGFGPTAAPKVASASSRWRDGVVTRGVRADRVGAKLSRAGSPPGELASAPGELKAERHEASAGTKSERRRRAVLAGP